MLATGVSATVELIFKPDSLAEFRYEISVATDSGRLLVPVLARRAASSLAGWPDRVLCGPCLIGDSTTIQCRITNMSRAPARFWFTPDTELPSDQSISNQQVRVI